MVVYTHVFIDHMFSSLFMSTIANKCSWLEHRKTRSVHRVYFSPFKFIVKDKHNYLRLQFTSQ